PSAIDPEVLSVNGVVLMFTGSLSGSGGGPMSSTDGLNFVSVQSNLKFGSSYSFVPVGDGRIRAFYAMSSGLGSALSTDGLNWTAEPGTRLDLSGGDWSVPNVVGATGGGCRAYFPSSPHLRSARQARPIVRPFRQTARASSPAWIRSSCRWEPAT